MNKLFYLFLIISGISFWACNKVPCDCSPFPKPKNLTPAFIEISNNDTTTILINDSDIYESILSPFDYVHTQNIDINRYFGISSPIWANWVNYNYDDSPNFLTLILDSAYKFSKFDGSTYSIPSYYVSKYNYYINIIGDTNYYRDPYPEQLLRLLFIDTLDKVHVYLSKDYNQIKANTPIDSILSIVVSEQFLYIQNNYSDEGLDFFDYNERGTLTSYMMLKELTDYNKNIHPFPTCHTILSFNEKLNRTDTFDITTEYVFTNNKVLRTIAEDVIIEENGKK